MNWNPRLFTGTQFLWQEGSLFPLMAKDAYLGPVPTITNKFYTSLYPLPINPKREGQYQYLV